MLIRWAQSRDASTAAILLWKMLFVSVFTLAWVAYDESTRTPPREVPRALRDRVLTGPRLFAAGVALQMTLDIAFTLALITILAARVRDPRGNWTSRLFNPDRGFQLESPWDARGEAVAASSGESPSVNAAAASSGESVGRPRRRRGRELWRVRVRGTRRRGRELWRVRGTMPQPRAGASEGQSRQRRGREL